MLQDSIQSQLRASKHMYTLHKSQVTEKISRHEESTSLNHPGIIEVTKLTAATRPAGLIG
jgi:hypothetical protein